MWSVEVLGGMELTLADIMIIIYGNFIEMQKELGGLCAVSTEKGGYPEGRRVCVPISSPSAAAATS